MRAFLRLEWLWLVSIGIPVPARVGEAVNIIIYTFYANKFLE